MIPVSLPDFFLYSGVNIDPDLVHREIESPIFYDHIPLIGKVCEYQHLDFDPLPEPILTPEPLDFSQFPESILISVLPEPKSVIPSFHTPFWDKRVIQKTLK